MCSLAPRAAAPGFGAATAFLDRQRGVVAAVAPAATSGHNAGERTRCARASEASAASARKRGRHDGLEHVVVDPAAASSALRIRMDTELVALQGLLKRAKLLPRSAAPPAEKNCAPAPRRSEAAPVVSPAAKRMASSPSKSSAATEAAYYAPAKQQRPVQLAAAKKKPFAPEVPNKKQRSAEAPAAAKPQQQHPVVQCAAAREEFRQMLLEMEKAALPDETIYPEDLEELGILFEHAVTRTRKQAWLEDHAKKQRAEEELARAKAREEFRRMLLEMEKAVPPDEMIYPEELEELGIVPRHGVGSMVAV